MILLIDNYDSFSYNLFQLVGSIEPDVRVVRNDELTVAEIAALAPEKLILCPAVITAVEFVTGCIVNLRLGMGVWDYSFLPFNLMGQICPQFTLIWLGLSFPGLLLCRAMKRLFSARQ